MTTGDICLSGKNKFVLSYSCMIQCYVTTANLYVECIYNLICISRIVYFLICYYEHVNMRSARPRFGIIFYNYVYFLLPLKQQMPCANKLSTSMKICKIAFIISFIYIFTNAFKQSQAILVFLSDRSINLHLTKAFM